MKKKLFCLMLAISALAFANKREDFIEKELMKKYPTLTDGTTTVKVHDYDVDIKEEKIKIEIELKGDEQKVAFEKLNQAKLAEFVAEMTNYAETELLKPLPIEVIVELDRDLLDDEELYRNTLMN